MPSDASKHNIVLAVTNLALTPHVALSREAAEAAVAAVNGMADGTRQQPMATDPAAARLSLPAGGETATGWAEQGMQIDGGANQQDDMVAAKFKPGIKFKLGV